jgi:GTPase SAR1 family protein
MNDDEKMIICKVVLLGDSGVGKTSIIQNYIFKRYNYKDISTIAANFQSKILDLNNAFQFLQTILQFLLILYKKYF